MTSTADIGHFVSYAMHEIIKKTGIPPSAVPGVFGPERNAVLLKSFEDNGFDAAGLDTFGKILNLTTDPDCRSCTWDGHVGLLGFNTLSQDHLVGNNDVEIYVFLKFGRDFGNKEAFRDFLASKGVPREYGFQYCARSYGIEDAPGRPFTAHFDCRHS